MSEQTLDKLIATLKSEAIETADKEAKQIVDNARAQAQKILKEAEAKRAELLNNAEKEAKATLDKGEGALKQAARDLTVSVQNDLLKLLKATLEQEVATTFTPELMEKAVFKVIENVGTGASLQLPENMDAALAEGIQKRLQESDSLEAISKDPNLLHGFTITKTNEGWSYHISPEAITDLLYEHLSTTWVNLLKNKSDR
jgi:F0F1-type ATP synthase membrane subunit b/b'